MLESVSMTRTQEIALLNCLVSGKIIKKKPYHFNPYILKVLLDLVVLMKAVLYSCSVNIQLTS